MALEGRTTKLIGILGVLALAIALLPGPSLAASHRDGPLLGNHAMDLPDIYVFLSPNDPSSAVIIMTTNPDAGRASFPANGLFEIYVDNDNDLTPDLTFSAFFDPPGEGGSQGVALVRVNGATPNFIASGLTQTILPVDGGGMFFAGTAADPRFADLDGLYGWLGENGTGRTLNDGSGANSLAGFNVNALALEVPISALSANGSSEVYLWGASYAFENNELFRRDRVGQPFLNMVFNSPGTRIEADPTAQEAYRQGDPVTDEAWIPNFASAFTRLSAGDAEGPYTLDQATDLAEILVGRGDRLWFDPVGSPGFPNGRRLADDVIDVSLNIWTGGAGFPGRDPAGAITTDGVGPGVYSDVFPYLMPSNPVVEQPYPALVGVVDQGLGKWFLFEPIMGVLDADQEVPGPGDTGAWGSALITVNTENQKVCFDLDVDGLSSPITGAHLHAGGVGESGGIIQDLEFGANGLAGCVTSTGTVIDQLLNDSSSIYVNVHTADHPAGAVRGQLSGGALPPFYFGGPGDDPFLADVNGDGVPTPGVRRANGQWFFSNHLPRDGGVPPVHMTTWFGNPLDVPGMGDFDGDGDDTMLLFRPSTGEYFHTNEIGSPVDIPEAVGDRVFFGNPNDDPFAADFNGDGRFGFGVKRGSTFFWRNELSTGFADGSLGPFGDGADNPLWGDWNGDGLTTPAVHRPGGPLYLKNSRTSGFADMEIFGDGFETGDVAVWSSVSG